MDVTPPSNLPAISQPWGRWAERSIVDLSVNAARSRLDSLNQNKQLNSSFGLLSGQVATLNTQQADLTAAQATLAAQQTSLTAAQADLTTVVAQLRSVADVVYATFNTGITGTAGWSASGFLPSVLIYTTTNRIEIGFGGALNNGDGYFCYSVIDNSTSATIVDRATVQADPASRVAVTGGASFAPSGWRTALIDVPVGLLLLVRLELYAVQAATYFFGGAILARGALDSAQLPTI